RHPPPAERGPAPLRRPAGGALQRGPPPGTAVPARLVRSPPGPPAAARGARAAPGRAARAVPRRGVGRRGGTEHEPPRSPAGRRRLVGLRRRPPLAGGPPPRAHPGPTPQHTPRPPRP